MQRQAAILFAAVAMMALPAAAVVAPGKTAPAWSGKTVAGKPMSSAQLKGKVVLMNFFNNYCSTCKEEYPHLQAMYKKYQGKGLQVVSVSNDETAQEAGAYAKELKATFPVLHDPKGAVYTKFGVSPIPANVIVNRSGKVVASIEGANIPQIEAAITKALGGK